MPTFLAITPVRTIKLPNRGTWEIPKCMQPKKYACPAWAIAPLECGTAGTQPEQMLRGITHVRHPEAARRPLGQLDLDIDAGGEVELHQRVHRLRRRLHDIEQPLVRPHLELLARLLVDVRRTVDGELLATRRQRNGTANERAGTPGGVGDVAG